MDEEERLKGLDAPAAGVVMLLPCAGGRDEGKAMVNEGRDAGRDKDGRPDGKVFDEEEEVDQGDMDGRACRDN